MHSVINILQNQPHDMETLGDCSYMNTQNFSKTLKSFVDLDSTLQE